jgi:excinuclease ABC subunit A
LADRLVIRGAREHNLKNVSLELPRDAMIVFTGLSGSGKSSLAFDTIFAEGQRRYVESLSAYARQFLGQLDRPDVDYIDGLSPAVSIDQKAASRNPRSTVGTATEVYDYLRLLFARVGQPHCPVCGRPVARQSPHQIVDQVLELAAGTRFQVLAPVVRGRKAEYAELLRGLAAKGYSRARVDGTVIRLESEIIGDLPEKNAKHDIEVVVDRLQVKPSARRRLTDSVETALSLSGGVVILDFTDLPESDPQRERMFSEHLACLYDDLSFDELEPRSFSFNSPSGACPDCTGLGRRMEVDPELIVPDESKSLREGAIAVWSGGHVSDYFVRLVEALGRTLGFTIDTPWSKLPGAARHALLHGHDQQVHIEYKTRNGRLRSYDAHFEGAIPYIERKRAEAEDETRFAGFMREVPCPACRGTRLKPFARAVQVDGRCIADFCAMPISELAECLRGLKLPGAQGSISRPILAEIASRLEFLLDVGLDYLAMDRAAATLAGGEAQRIRLASQIGSGLAGVLYVLDEPSIGLHQRDNRRLLETLIRLRDLGNTLIVVEHDEDTIRAADWVVDIGPQAGEHGGNIVVSGPPEDLLASRESLTGAYLSGRKSIGVPAVRRKRSEDRQVVVEGASANNLRNVDVAFPLGLFVAVTGVSGSGKSTLVNDILYRALARELNGAASVPGKHTRVTGMQHLDNVVRVDQGPIGVTPRSNPATYTGVFDHIRRLFAQTTEAKVRGYQPGRFSFNVKGGRCEACSGDGTIKIEMQFLPDVYVPCEVCHGARYNTDTLQVHYKGRTIAEVLDMPIEEGAEFFAPVPAIHRHLKTLVDVGLGYVRLGQPAPTLSGGEAQRVKLASELQRRATGRTVYVLDEPTTGLHFEDIRKLLGVLTRLVDTGNTVIVIEHNLDVIKTADWVIDLGPEGGAGGGLVVATGPPEKIAAVEESYTGQFLKQLLDRKLPHKKLVEV